LGNATKFTLKGSVVLSVEKVHQKQHTCKLRFEVCDTGIGIAREHHDKLFRSFSQVDGSMTRKYGGTGLGLTITKQLVELMGGSIGMTSELGQGSSFFFDLSLQEGDEVTRRSDSKSYVIPESRRQLKVLLVEDDKLNQTLATRLLEKQGHVVTIANNGQAAVQCVKGNRFDLVLMDISMPVMDGVEATKIIREELKMASLPIVALTAHAIKGDKDHFMQAGMDGYISKPIQMDHFYHTIDRVTSLDQDVDQIVKKLSDQTETESISEEDLHDYFIELESASLRIQEAIRQEDYKTVEETAHYLKTVATTMGDKTVKKWAFKLELEARKENQIKLIALWKELQSEVERVERGLA
jgi:CheY-like chemotaxis protein